VSGLNDWKLRLHFAPGEDAGFNPVIEIPAATPTVTVAAQAQQPANLSDQFWLLHRTPPLLFTPTFSHGFPYTSHERSNNQWKKLCMMWKPSAA
jgi:hypothetical protein